MSEHWFVIANQIETKILARTGLEKLDHVKELLNPVGKERNRDLHGKTPGVSVRSGPHGAGITHMEGEKMSPHEEAAVVFAKQIDDFLDLSRKNNHFKFLTVVAEPHFLGKIRSAMNPHVLKTVVDWIEKDLSGASERDLPEVLNLKNSPEPIQ